MNLDTMTLHEHHLQSPGNSVAHHRWRRVFDVRMLVIVLESGKAQYLDRHREPFFWRGGWFFGGAPLDFYFFDDPPRNRV